MVLEGGDTLNLDERNDRMLLGTVPFDLRNFAGAVSEVVRAATQRNAVPVRLVNAWSVVLADDDNAYRDTLHAPGLNYADGLPVAKVLKRRSARPDVEQIRGPSLFAAVLDEGRGSHIRHFLLGSTPEVMESLVEAIGKHYPGCEIVGTHSPPFGPLSDEFYETCTEAIIEADPDMVWVGMGTPKQDFAALELATTTGRPCVGVGAAFDFLAGTSREAPTWMRRVGLEWLFRLATEPRRLAKRYLLGNGRFILIVLREKRGGVPRSTR